MDSYFWQTNAKTNLFMKIKICLLFLVVIGSLKAQTQKSSSEILHDLKKLQNATTVLYLAAHPDDENTRMISYLTNGFGARTAYMSLTRGDGGQNLIGTELGAKLGVLRTQELMQARNIDGGTQFFSRAVDFGYSKTADETLEKWGQETILKDVVWMVRKFQPDVIITRFPPDKRGGHGHHTASAMLGIKAFNMAGDPNSFPEQLNFIETWQPKRIYWNTSKWWGDQNLDSLVEHTDDYVTMEVGGYNALQGTSYNELASLSRTQHKSQGFGVSVGRGEEMEYLQHLDGDKAKNDLFDGISRKWERFGFIEGDKALNAIVRNFDLTAPEASVKALLELRTNAQKINNLGQKEYFIENVNALIVQCLGLHFEALAEKEYLGEGENAKVEIQILQRRGLKESIKFSSVSIGDSKFSIPKSIELNKKMSTEISFDVPNSASQPYWLRARYVNVFEVRAIDDIGKPENDPTLSAVVVLNIGKESLKLAIPVQYKFSDRVEGEIIRPVIVVPIAVVSADRDNLIFSNSEEQTLNLSIRFFQEKETQLTFSAKGWIFSPSSMKVSGREGEVVNRTVIIKPGVESYKAKVKVMMDGKVAQSLYEIDYSHIEKRLVFENVAPKLIKIRLKTEGKRIGYIPGAGDKVAEAIEYMGYEVDILDEEKIKNGDLSKYQAIVAGIRAYNTEKWLPNVKSELMTYVKNGGNYIVQYNTRSRDLLSQNIGPYPFVLSRERVTNEYAIANFLIEDHPLLTTPNVLDMRDFAGWVQERGLYFAGSWDDAYQTPIGWSDNGEPLRKGGLIIADHGKGAFIYTGISFFRELPAGVTGAYRLLANILSYSQATNNGK